MKMQTNTLGISISNSEHSCLGILKNYEGYGNSSSNGWDFNFNTNEFNTNCIYDGDYIVGAFFLSGNILSENRMTIRATGAGGSGEPNALLLVQKARDMLSGCPSFFEPPSSANNFNPNLKNTSGSVSWSSTWVNKRTSFNDPGDNETKAHFIQKLINATLNNQQSWYQYLCGYYNNDFTKGFPYPWFEDELSFNFFGINSFVTCSSGFVCYAFIWAAAKESGYSLPYDFRGGSHGDPFEKLLQYQQIIPITNRKIGDIVIYDTNPSTPDYEHVGIITQVDMSDMRKDKVISSYGFSEHFHWGAKEVNLWDFHSTRVNPPGIFTSVLDGGKWPQEHDNWNLSNIKIVRLQ